MSTQRNPFLLPENEYQRDIDIKKGYVQQTAKYISCQLKRPYKDCLVFVLDEVGKSAEAFGFKDPPMEQLIRKGVGHREVDETTFMTYIEDVIETERILSPSLVVYERPDVEKSVIAEWLDDNIAARKRSKKEMFRLKQIGQLLQSALADYDQNARKIRINSVSGMHGFAGNPLYQATGHSSLTSMCRAAAGYGNGTVERFLAGSRHYHTPEIAKANLMAMITIEDMTRFQAVVDRYQLTYPTTDDVMSLVRRSTDLYWDTPHELDTIRECVDGMTPLEKCVVCYSGDLYHLALLNPDLVRELMGSLIAQDISDMEEVNTREQLQHLDATEGAYINGLCASVLKGTTLDLVEENDPVGWQVIGKTAKRFQESTQRYDPLINTLFTPKHLPPTVASMKSIQRRACLAADTDSSIFTTEYWVEWYSGHLKRGDIEDRIWYLATFMVCQCIAHAMAMLSANVGVERSQLFRLAMKNEYAFPEFALTNLAKHYFSTMSIREGNVFDELEMEIKGVELRGSTSTQHILKGCEKLMTDTLHAVDRGEKLSAYDTLTLVANSEIETIQSIRRGEYTYLKSAQIKPDGPKMPHHELWQEVFGPKYRMSIDPPYPCVKITTQLVNKTLLNEWLDDMADQELSARMRAWLVKYNRKDLKTL